MVVDTEARAHYERLEAQLNKIEGGEVTLRNQIAFAFDALNLGRIELTHLLIRFPREGYTSMAAGAHEYLRLAKALASNKNMYITAQANSRLKKLDSLMGYE